MTRQFIYYGIPTYKSLEECKNSVEALFSGTVVPDQIIIVDNSGTGASAIYLQELVSKYQNIYIWPQTHNIGVSKAWNLLHTQLNADYLIIANDDVSVHTHTIERMITAANDNPHIPMLYGDGSSGNAYSLFLYRKWAFRKYGGFDEAFSPAYFEDNDMWYRLHVLAQEPYLFVPGATYDHVVSSTLQKYTQVEREAHNQSFQANQAYYLRKWGGMPHQEVYKTAFNQ